MFRWIDRFLDRACAVIGAFFLSQVPVFMQQYIQGLGGHIRELQLQVNLMNKAALASGKTLSEWIAKAVSSSDPDFNKQGEILQGMVLRFDQFSQAMTAWHDANLFERPFVFFRHMNMDVAKGTYQAFQYGLAFNLEGGIYALIGLILGFSIYIAITRSFKLLWTMLFKKKDSSIESPKPL